MVTCKIDNNKNAKKPQTNKKGIIKLKINKGSIKTDPGRFYGMQLYPKLHLNNSLQV